MMSMKTVPIAEKLDQKQQILLVYGELIKIITSRRNTAHIIRQ